MAGNTVNDFHIAIVGAGIAGLALAMGLHKKGISFTLYEEAKEYSVAGAGIGFAPNGLRAMDIIEPEFRPKYEKICVGNKPADAQNVFFEGLLIKEGLGQDQTWHGKSCWGHPDFNRKSAHRKELLEIMTSFIPIETVKFNKSLKDIKQHSDKVGLKFADGDVAEASICVGADGIKSIAREHVLKPSYPTQVAPVYADAYCYRGVISMSEAKAILGDLTDVAKMYFGNKRSVVTYRITGGEEFNFLLCVATDTPWMLECAVTEKVTEEIKMADFEGPDIDDRFRRLLRLAKPIKWGLFHHKHTSTYYRDRVVLMGDSAHASLPFQAAGAAQGLEDALILSAVFGELPTAPQSISSLNSYILAAFDAYDSVRRPRAQKQLDRAAEVGDMVFFRDQERGSDMGKILPRLQDA
ncbi:UbiH 2-polyprenyl-6-methoxyphenol hydroxylase, partial [Pyrenophora tritici-repentis]